jgi:hypothetical protein
VSRGLDIVFFKKVTQLCACRVRTPIVHELQLCMMLHVVPKVMVCYNKNIVKQKVVVKKMGSDKGSDSDSDSD